MMLFKIGEISKILGISSESIRRYEKANLVTAMKDEDTGYRYFDLCSFNIISRIRFYRKCGFTLSECYDLLHAKSTKVVPHLLDQRVEQLAVEIQFKQKSIQRLNELSETLNQIPQTLNTFQYVQSPDFYYVPYFTKGIIQAEVQHKQLILDFMELMPLSNSSPLFLQGKNGFEDSQYYYGLSIEKKYLDDQDMSHAYHFESRKAVYTCIECSCEESLDIHVFHDFFAFAKKEKLDIHYFIGRTLITIDLNHQLRRYHEFWGIY